MERRSNNVYYVSNGRPRDARGPQGNIQYVDPRANRQREEVRRQQKDSSSSSSGFGYFIAAVVGIAAGFIAKAFFDEEEKVTKTGGREAPVQNSVNQFEPQRPNNETSDPIDSQLEECNDIVCPITLEVMSDPVISKRCGHSFEGHAIVTWLKSKDYCPKCHTPLQRTDLVKNFSLKNTIDYMRKQAKGKDGK